MSPVGNELSCLSQLFYLCGFPRRLESVEGSWGITIHEYTRGQDLALKSSHRLQKSGPLVGTSTFLFIEKMCLAVAQPELNEYDKSR